MSQDPFVRYLAAKKTVDDRSLNQHVWRTLVDAMPAEPVAILEIGAGIGTMIERALAWSLFSSGTYLALDAMPANSAALRQRLLADGFSEADGALRRGRVRVSAETIDIYDFLTTHEGSQQWDVMIAHAFLDLVDIPSILPRLFSLLKPGGLFYFTLTFDGITALEPVVDNALDAQIERLYHETMDRRVVDGRPSGDSRSGRHLLTHVRKAGGHILAVGSSDWVVLADPAGRYAADEAYFLRFIVDTMEQALRPEPTLAAADLSRWADARRAQIDRGELIYVAHQLDVVGRVADSAETT